MYQPVIDVLKEQNRVDFKDEMRNLNINQEELLGQNRVEINKIDKLMEELKIDFRK
jgi:hypothetical protein